MELLLGITLGGGALFIIVKGADLIAALLVALVKSVSLRKPFGATFREVWEKPRKKHAKRPTVNSFTTYVSRTYSGARVDSRNLWGD